MDQQVRAVFLFLCSLSPAMTKDRAIPLQPADAAIEVARQMRERMGAPGESARIVLAQPHGEWRQPGTLGRLLARSSIQPWIFRQKWQHAAIA